MSYPTDNSRVHGFLHTKGKLLVNGDGEEVLLRGWGAGNWNNPEGFMIGAVTNFTGAAVQDKVVRASGMDRGRSFIQIVRETCGSRYATDFWNRWMNTYMTEDDFILMEKLGYNSVRLPISARCFLEEEPGYIWVEEAFEMLGRVLDWCKKHHIYGILDLHGAVAGQSCLPCDDGIDNQPRLFMEEESYERTIVLMEEFARRFAEHEGLGGYNIVNEPLSNFSGDANDKYIPKLKQFYLDCIRRMRVYDKNHAFFLEGNHFTNRVSIFDQDYDPECHNWVLTLHCYSKRPEYSAIAPALAKADKLGVPVWMAETGGPNRWMSAQYEMLLEHHIGYCVWSWECVEGGNAGSVIRHKLPEGWDKINAYVSEGAARPSYAESQAIFDRYIDCLKFENCTVSEDATIDIFRRKGAVIPASGFNLSPGRGISYKGNDPYGNEAAYRPGTGMEMVFAPGYTSRETVMGKPRPDTDWENLQLVLHKGDFTCYTCRELTSGCGVSLRCRADETAVVSLRSGNTLLGTLTINPTSELIDTETLPLPEDQYQVLRVESEEGTVILSDLLIR